VETVGDIDYAVIAISELEALFDSCCDIEIITELEDITIDIFSIAEPRTPTAE
jgi:hypothetical protein